MKSIYLYDVGIRPWEQTTSVADHRFATITVVQRSVSDLLGLWLTLVTSVSERLPRALKWRTVGHSIEGSKVQELKLLKQLRSGLVNDDLLRKNEDSNIYSYVKRLSESMSEFDLNTITQAQYTSLLFLPDREPSIATVWKVFKNSDTGLDAMGMERTLDLLDNLLICRVTESDTHVSTQFIGVVEQVDELLVKLNDLNITRVESDDVAKLISN
ncbi:hypothetical protein C9J03_00990 [Photobacterium gaetbulicola]|uniref:Uncharacterized protein n=1 Tax=Photobacterium gaetbulicola Gung47 TaxID=658445 RepID=A0A0C5WRX8_9GAMM|nr:hypothetical protein [Photobacterium gaetbulicola]AJR05715.1 hypothetical protein H744_1c0690 [Photobacterium gaetbulicola Gung47]PSU14685.1 hypothetical protein C9J03_00990 [Photobacterium gaetbulicola]